MTDEKLPPYDEDVWHENSVRVSDPRKWKEWMISLGPVILAQARSPVFALAAVGTTGVLFGMNDVSTAAMVGITVLGVVDLLAEAYVRYSKHATRQATEARQMGANEPRPHTAGEGALE